MKDKIEQMTVAEAIAAGYEYYTDAERDGWQTLERLDTDIDDADNRELVLSQKEEQFPGIDAESIRDVLSEHIGTIDADESGRDTDDVFDAINDMPIELFETLADQINEALKSCGYRFATNIRLVR